jgi:hypothetical protein
MLLGKQQGVMGIPPINSQLVTADAVPANEKAKSLPITLAPSVVWFTTGELPRTELPTETGAEFMVETGPNNALLGFVFLTTIFVCFCFLAIVLWRYLLFLLLQPLPPMQTALLHTSLLFTIRLNRNKLALVVLAALWFYACEGSTMQSLVVVVIV